jgi:Ca2+-binding EF-hand superfamily protein
MKSNTLKTGIITGVIALAFTLNMNAQSSDKQERGKKPPSFEKLLEKMDKNEDGKLSKKEVKGPLKEHFSKIDTNEDGFISEKEFEEAPKPKRKERK